MFEIKLASREMLAQVAMLEKQCSAFAWSEKGMQESALQVYVCCKNDQVVGYVGCKRVVQDLVHIVCVGVDIKFRRQGVAKQLFAVVLAAFEKQTQITLEVRASNAAAIALYESMGFALQGVQKKGYPDGEDAVIYTHIC